MSTYAALDERILQCIAAGAGSYDEIVNACCEAAYLADADRSARGTIRERMDGLRIAGFIEHVGAWAAARYETPPSRQTLVRWCANGNIPGAVREGRAWYVPADATYSAAATNEWRIAAYGR